MKVEFLTSFSRDIRRIRDRDLLRRIQRAIEAVEAASTLQEIRGLRRLQAEGRYYRIRLGEYRIGLVIDDDTVVFVRFLNRNEFYRYFP
ncbi:MAG: type II toxin-antitoxin system RelE/ParE family toxin [Chloroflexi bacterium]|nr:type II toxin-antitoxin system RelE/ParE family toxin [Chloroflexota bacterium]